MMSDTAAKEDRNADAWPMDAAGRGEDASARPASPRPIPYTAAEVARTFTAQREALDFSDEIQELGLGRLRFLKRSRAGRQLTALSVALWKLALERSFPADADTFFRHYLETSPLLSGDGKREKRLTADIRTYVELLAAKGDTDFSAVAGHLVSSLGLRQDDFPSLRLRLSLRIRAVYSFIFDKLI
jgi:hypothetical protein